jgi:hypothetical protein
MRSKLLQILLLAFIPSILSAQEEGRDTIFTYDPDTIVCFVDHMDEDYVYYKLFQSETESQISRISRDQVASIFEYNQRYYDLSKITESADPSNTDTKNTKLIESGGVIYQAYLDSPPVFQGGEQDLIMYLQNNMENQAQSSQIYGSSLVKVLFEATIDSNGIISDVVVSQASVTTGNVDETERSIENQLKNVVAQMPAWTPAVYQGQNVTVSIYIPIQFQIRANAVILYSGKNTYVFSNMNYSN